MFVLGLTGSIGMGKSTVAGMFRDLGVPVHDADAEVHRLYGEGGAAVAPVAALHPEAVVDGAVDRRILSSKVVGDETAMRRLETVVHPLVQRAETAFLAEAFSARSGLAILEIPLLLETGADLRCDAVAVVSAPAEVQKARVLARPEMNEAKFMKILSRQIGDGEKRRRAHFVIDTGAALPVTAKQVEDVVLALAGRPGSAYARQMGDGHGAAA
ncbi:dephospho-CoA kinase [Lutibaculum baratangense]|nr:dephospho-CoA kinase [Lutibaculum baratangense]